MDLSAVMPLAERLAQRLSLVEGVEAVVLTGSWARGEGRPNSDIDMAIFYDPLRPPAHAELQALAREVDDRHPEDALSELGAWGPWLNGGGWLEVEGHRVDWVYRDLSLVRRLIDECQAGVFTSHYQPGYPHGFHSHSYLGEVHACLPLSDPQAILAGLKAATNPYPPRLKQAVVEGIWEADFSLSIARKSAARGEVFFVTGCLFRCAAVLVQVLFALNERYITNEKGAVDRIDGFAKRPLRFSETLSALLAKPGYTPSELDRSIQRMAELVEAVHELLKEPEETLPTPLLAQG